ncbi:hypothetical protein HZU77_000145 [Neisseriaceae bacterium TC5R-5]|nr:hypothetical protein [Neisseriaceae bacterium TC5R-5]
MKHLSYWALLLCLSSAVALAAPSLPAKRTLPSSLLLTVQRAGSEYLHLPLCVNAQGQFSGNTELDQAPLHLQGKVETRRTHTQPLLTISVHWQNQNNPQDIHAQIPLDDKPQLLGSLLQQIYPYGEHSNTIAQHSTLNLTVQTQLLSRTCQPSKET